MTGAIIGALTGKSAAEAVAIEPASSAAATVPIEPALAMDAPLFKRSLAGHSNTRAGESTRLMKGSMFLGCGVLYSQQLLYQEFKPCAAPAVDDSKWVMPK